MPRLISGALRPTLAGIFPRKGKDLLFWRLIMGVRSDVAFVICKEDYEALERAFEKHFPEFELLDCFDLIETVEGKGETWFVYVCREIKWYTEDPDIAFLMSCLKEKRTQFAEACEAGYSESWNCTHFEDWVGVQSQPQLVLNV